MNGAFTDQVVPRASFYIIPATAVTWNTAPGDTHYFELVFVIVVLNVSNISVKNAFSRRLFKHPVVAPVTDSLATMSLTDGGAFDVF